MPFKEWTSQPISDGFEGALLHIARTVEGHLQSLGTGFMVAPGIAFTARHVVEGAVDGELPLNALYALGSKKDTLNAEVWLVVGAAVGPINDDIAILYLVPRFDHGDEMVISTFPLSARVPENGEAVAALGMVGVSREPTEHGGILEAEGLWTNGRVIEVVARTHRVDNLCVRANFDSPSGTSGGPIIDESGHVVAVMSHSYEFEDSYEAYGSLIAVSCFATLNAPWPPEWYRDFRLWEARVHRTDTAEVSEGADGSMSLRYPKLNISTAE